MSARSAGSTLRSTCSSWYLGANIPGKPRVFMPYIGGFPAYIERCEAVVRRRLRGLHALISARPAAGFRHVLSIWRRRMRREGCSQVAAVEQPSPTVPAHGCVPCIAGSAADPAHFARARGGGEDMLKRDGAPVVRRPTCRNSPEALRALAVKAKRVRRSACRTTRKRQRIIDSAARLEARGRPAGASSGRAERRRATSNEGDGARTFGAVAAGALARLASAGGTSHGPRHQADPGRQSRLCRRSVGHRPSPAAQPRRRRGDRRRHGPLRRAGLPRPGHHRRAAARLHAARSGRSRQEVGRAPSARRRRAGSAPAWATSPTSTRTARSSRPTTASGSSSWATGCGTPTAPTPRSRRSTRCCRAASSRRGAAAPSSPTCARPTTRSTRAPRPRSRT